MKTYIQDDYYNISINKLILKNNLDKLHMLEAKLHIVNTLSVYILCVGISMAHNIHIFIVFKCIITG